MGEKQQKTPFKDSKDYREGHRKRLRERLKKGGPDAIQDHELLELIMFRAILRADVKQLAHQLLDDYGDLSAVLSAPERELKAYRGIGDQVISEFRVIETAALRLGQENRQSASLAELGRADCLLPHPHGGEENREIPCDFPQ